MFLLLSYLSSLSWCLAVCMSVCLVLYLPVCLSVCLFTIASSAIMCSLTVGRWDGKWDDWPPVLPRMPTIDYCISTIHICLNCYIIILVDRIICEKWWLEMIFVSHDSRACKATKNTCSWPWGSKEAWQRAAKAERWGRRTGEKYVGQILPRNSAYGMLIYGVGLFYDAVVLLAAVC